MAACSYIDLMATDEQIHIILRDAEPVIAPLHDCRAFSNVAKALPETQQWNLSDILIDGEHVKRETVLQWLSALEQLTEHVPPAEDSQTCTAAFLYELLAFADAVGSRRGLLMACISNLPALELQLAVAEQQLRLPIEVGGFFFRQTADDSDDDEIADATEAPEKADTFILCQEVLGATGAIVFSENLTQQQRDSIAEQVAQQLEQLLYMSYKLNLEPLIDRLHAIIRCNTMDGSYIVQQQAESILFTQRVLSAMGISSYARTRWSNSLFGEHCDLIEEGTSALFVPVDPEDALKPMGFQAVLQRPFMGQPKGAMVHVRIDFADASIAITKQGPAEDHACAIYHSFEMRLTSRGVTS